MKKNNLRKGILVASSLILAAAISVGATLAYLTAKTNTKTNVFTAGGGITIVLDEPSYKTTTDDVRMPGDEFAKDPLVKNTTTDSPVYTVMSLEYLIDDKQVDYDTFTKSTNEKHVTIKTGDDDTGFNTGFNKAWTKLTDSNDNLDYFIYGKKDKPEKVTAKGSTVPIFDKVVISEADKGNTTYKINAKAYAVNADDTVTAAEAFTGLAELVNSNAGDTIS